MKYRPARAAETAALRAPGATDPVTQALLALTGYGTAHLTPRLLAGHRPDPALRRIVRHAAALGGSAGGDVVRLAGHARARWRSSPAHGWACRWTSGRGSAWRGEFNRLAMDAAIGVRAWDPQARFVLRVGPLDRAGFERLLPDRLALHQLVSLTRAYVGFELGFADQSGAGGAGRAAAAA